MQHMPAVKITPLAEIKNFTLFLLLFSYQLPLITSFSLGNLNAK